MSSSRIKNKLVPLLVLLTAIAIGCQTMPTKQSYNSLELTQLTEWMSGTFSSAKQSEADSTFFSISLVMVPIWQENTEAKWLYVEQAVTKNLVKPYRQRIYKLTQLPDKSFSSEIFELPDPEKFIQAWNTPELFSTINPNSLMLREGCAVSLEKVSSKEYAGSTNEANCRSTLYGASYATSKVQVFRNKIISWDQGWDDNENQVWGAENEGYIFDRVD